MNTDLKRYDSEAPKLFSQFLDLIGEDTKRDGLAETPERVSRMYREILSGYSVDPASVMKTFDVSHSSSMVVVKNIPFYSLCEHHLVPFFGGISVGYLPNKRVLGLSKFARLVEVFARRLQIQEQLNAQIADAIMEYLQPRGVIVLSEAEHLCMAMRGINKVGVDTTVLTKRGLFADDQNLVDEFFAQAR